MENMENRIEKVRAFYGQLLRYITLNALGIVIWTLSGGGYFWPIWVILLWGLDLAYQANNLNLLKQKAKYAKKVLDYAKHFEDKLIKEVKKNDDPKKPSKDKAVKPAPTNSKGKK